MKLKPILLIASISLVVFGVGVFGFLEIRNKLQDLRYAHQNHIHEPDSEISVPLPINTILMLLAVGVIGALSVHRKNKTSKSTFQNNSSQTPYDLKFNPSNKPAGTRYFWFGEPHLKAIEGLKKAARSDANFIILSGDSGVGKTTLIKYLKNELLPEYISLEAGNEFQDANDLYMLIAHYTGINGSYESKGAFFVRFNQYLHGLQAENKKILLIFDDFTVINDKLIKELTFLSNITIRHQKIIKILLSGENISFSPSEPDKPTNSLVVTCRLERLNRSETNSYIDYKLRTAGTNNSIFPTETKHKIYLHSQGITRDINKICDCALSLGNEQKLQAIAPGIIERCCQELNLLTRWQVNNHENIPQKIEPTKDLSDNFFDRFSTWKFFNLLKSFKDINKQWAIDRLMKALQKSHLFIQGAAKDSCFKQWNNCHTKISISRLFDSYLWNSLLSVSLVTLALTFALWYQGIFPFKPDNHNYSDFQKKYYTPEIDKEVLYDEKNMQPLEQLNVGRPQQFSSYQQLNDSNEQKKLKSKLPVNEPNWSKAAYFVQVGAFLIKRNAINTARMLKKKGYLARIVTFIDSKDRLWHTVRIGEYVSLKNATKHAANFSEQEKMDSIVLPLGQQ